GPAQERRRDAAHRPGGDGRGRSGRAGPRGGCPRASAVDRGDRRGGGRAHDAGCRRGRRPPGPRAGRGRRARRGDRPAGPAGRRGGGGEAGKVTSRMTPGLEDGKAPATKAKGEDGRSGGGPTTEALGEEGGPVTDAINENGGPSTRALGEEGGGRGVRIVPVF